MNTLKYIGILLCLTILQSSIMAQSAGNVIYNNPALAAPQKINIPLNQVFDYTVNLSAEVMINVPASSYSVIFAAAQNGISAEETDNMMQTRIDNVISELMKAGIKKKDIHIDLISFVPTYALKLEEKKFSKTANEIPTGFQLKKNIHVLIYDHDLLTIITSIMAKSEIYDIVKVDYNLDNLNLFFDTLRNAAIQTIKMKETTYKKMGLRLDIENMFDGFNASYPLERYANYTVYYTGSSIEEIKVAKKKKEDYNKNIVVMGNNPTVNINVKNPEKEDDTQFIVKYSDKNKTMYYNKIPYNQFDVVINADYTEPRIQLVYSIKAKYQVQNLEKYELAKKSQEEMKEKQKKSRKG